MKFEDFLMQPSEEKQSRVDLQEEDEKLQDELNGEVKLNKALQCALQGPIHSCPRLSSLIPLQVQVLLAELAMVEEEITWLERKVEELKLSLYQEQRRTKEWEMLQLQQQRSRRHQKHLLCGQRNQTELKGLEQLSRSQNYEQYKKYKFLRARRAARASVGSALDIQSMSPPRSKSNLLIYL
ncbi:hypothetical protein F0562_026162 [Nyssa sinensis]|uniref:Ternary complex factor MIP1 leucine-zipper domain-containing protein n=1 Tax=Nyssa sinensis TaxID=561372 RepID=A0A5J5BAH0_9ASTE|nr:hypothetical protein F0562_026162 [Nyssa sinensis]